MPTPNAASEKSERVRHIFAAMMDGRSTREIAKSEGTRRPAHSADRLRGTRAAQGQSRRRLRVPANRASGAGAGIARRSNRPRQSGGGPRVLAGHRAASNQLTDGKLVLPAAYRPVDEAAEMEQRFRRTSRRRARSHRRTPRPAEPRAGRRRREAERRAKP